MPLYYLDSLGCAKNLVDSEVFAHILSRHGYEQTDDAEIADIILVNTCAFLQSAMTELDEVLCDLAEIKKPKQRLIVTGCVMNRDKDEFINWFPEVDNWIPLKDFSAFEQMLFGSVTTPEGRQRLSENPYAYLRISDGCNNRCSYCTIPSIRGNLQSQPLEDLVIQAQKLAERGARELVIIAQDTCSYGLDLYGRKALPELIERLHGIDGFRWLRLMYLHPDNYEPEWIDLHRKYPKLLPYFELPIQHIDDDILKAMNRKKTGSQIIDLFDVIRLKIPEASLRTTLITGFPGETDAAFHKLKDLIRKVLFLHLGIFEFSPEPGTLAFDLSDKIEPKLASRRLSQLTKLHRKTVQKELEKYIGQALECIVDTPAVHDDKTLIYQNHIGRAWFQAPEVDGVVHIDGGDLVAGDFALVEITDQIDIDLFGKFIRKLS